MRPSHLLLTASLLALPSMTALAFSGSWTQSASVTFDRALSVSKNSDMNFGTVSAGVATTYRLFTTGNVTVITGTGQRLYGTPVPGNITISGSSTQTINISAGSFVANNGVSLTTARCAYDGGGEGSCTINGAAAPGAGKTLLIGVRAVVDGTQASGSSAAPSLTITVLYS
jgi:hypothetical protein